MSSDQDYAAFLDKANEDPAKGVAASGAGRKKRVEFRTTEEGVVVPAVLIRVCSRGAFYVSDADEPFKPVALGWDEGGKGLPDEGEFFFFFSFFFFLFILFVVCLVCRFVGWVVD